MSARWCVLAVKGERWLFLLLRFHSDVEFEPDHDSEPEINGGCGFVDEVCGVP